MKKIISILLLTFAMVCAMAQQNEYKMLAMAKAIACVESNNTDNAVNGNCVGWLQISPIMVREANRLIGEDYFDTSDRWNRLNSYLIFQIIMERYNPSLSLRKACKLWNPKAGDWYYRRVLKHYTRIVNNKETALW